MAHFHRVPGGDRVSTQTVNVRGTNLTLGLWSPHDFANVELDVRSNATTVRCVKQGMSGASRLWQITGTDGAT
ncbi:MAG: hypothetical protein H7Y20_12415, partial [Bryobacteraceae bacterium]|nr:hypothetical protein [Bryobacteraceae bacterium]